jgi:molybdenum cofactor guanylyltransferase
MTADDQIDCLGIVLAGGQSSRMKKEKALLSRNGQSMLAFSQQLLIDAGLNNVIVSGAQVGGIADTITQAGPLAGIYTLIDIYRPQAIMALPVDMPLLTAKHMKELKHKGELTAKAICFNQCFLPLYLPVTTIVKQYLRQAFASEAFKKTGKGPSFKEIFMLTNGISIPLVDTHVLLNTNTPEQWQEAQQYLKKWRNYV